MRQQLFFDESLKDFANDRRGAESPWVCCAGGFCGRGNYCAVPVLRDLGKLKGEVKHLGKYRGNVGAKGLREKPIRASTLMRVKAVHDTSDFQFSNEGVRHTDSCAWLKYGINPASSRSN